MKESEIRPQALFDRYLDLLQEDIYQFFSDQSAFVDIPCPGCGGGRGKTELEKWGFQFRLCADCWSLFVCPRPGPDALDRYYRKSAAVRYWDSAFYRETEHARREKIFRPRAELLVEWAGRLGVGRDDTCVDIGAGYGTFLEEIASHSLFSEVVGIEPVHRLAEVCRAKGFRIVEKTLEAVEPGEVTASIATAFEVLEHVFDPAGFLGAARRILRPGGGLVLTTLTASGFDIQVLWEHARSVHPPLHLNFLSVQGIRRLVERCGLQVVELSTPGRLDVDIVENALARNPAMPVPRFVRTLLARGEAAHAEFQEFLQRHCLSSHLRVIARA
jgi:2-polyprenyl-3-methyl-5-hydroxy-6-metoxy-1,4-benzoquinol methylase